LTFLVFTSTGQAATLIIFYGNCFAKAAKYSTTTTSQLASLSSHSALSLLC